MQQKKIVLHEKIAVVYDTGISAQKDFVQRLFFLQIFR